MRIASEIDPNGAVTGVAFEEGLKAIIRETKPTFIIETGTYMGTGSTTAILDALRENGEMFEFWSIECNPHHHAQAVRNLGSVEGLNLLKGLSVPQRLIPLDIDFSTYPDDVIVDFQPHEREEKYLAEVRYDVPDDMLGKAVKYSAPDLVLLDSAGHMGTIEYDYLMKKVKKPFILALDDTSHVKHFKTLEKIKNDKRFTILFETEDKFGGCIAKFTPSRSRKTSSKKEVVSS